jgi:hypothetical protein
MSGFGQPDVLFKLFGLGIAKGKKPLTQGTKTKGLDFLYEKQCSEIDWSRDSCSKTTVCE